MKIFFQFVRVSQFSSLFQDFPFLFGGFKREANQFIVLSARKAFLDSMCSSLKFVSRVLHISRTSELTWSLIEMLEITMFVSRAFCFLFEFDTFENISIKQFFLFFSA